MRLASTIRLMTMATALSAAGAGASPDISGRTTTQPSVSPDGSMVAFVSNYDGGDHVFVSRIDGSQLRQLTFGIAVNSGQSSDGEPAWSPSGAEILFTSNRSGRQDIWGVYPDGGALRQITNNAGNNDQPAWSPDGSFIAFVSDRAGTNDLWVMNADGSGARRLTTLAGQENHPSFSPTSTEVVFSETVNRASTLMIVPVAGGAPRALTTGTMRDWYPAWSTFGIAFSSNRSGQFAIWTIRPDGSDMRLVSASAAWDPVWTPTGRILCTREADGSNVFSLDRVSGNLQQVTHIDGIQVGIEFSPSSNRTIAVNGSDPVRIAALSTATFDARRVVARASLTFGRTGYETSLIGCDDANNNSAVGDPNRDGRPDLVCRFAANRTGLTSSDTEAIWRGRDADGFKIEGRIAVRVVSR